MGNRCVAARRPPHECSDFVESLGVVARVSRCPRGSWAEGFDPTAGLDRLFELMKAFVGQRDMLEDLRSFERQRPAFYVTLEDVDSIVISEGIMVDPAHAEGDLWRIGSVLREQRAVT